MQVENNIIPEKNTPRFKLAKHWYDLLVQVVVIFVSITLSFAFNNWQEKRKNRETEVFYLRQIRQNLMEAAKELEQDITYYGQLQAAYAYFQRYDVFKNAAPDSLFDYHNFFYYEVFPNTNKTGFEILKNTGKLEIISNKIILTQLVQTYQENLPALQIATDDYLRYKREMVVPYLTQHLIIVDYATKKSNLLDLVKNPIFRNIYYRERTTWVLEKYNALLTSYRQLEKEIDAELANA